MRINIEEECFSRLSKLVDILGVDAREALGTLAFLWHDSQEILKIQGSFEDIIDWCRINKLNENDQNKWIKGLCKARFLTETHPGIFVINGNETQIDNRLKHLQKSRKGADATKQKWLEIKSQKEGHWKATGLPQAGQHQAPTTLNTRQGNTRQSNKDIVTSDDATPPPDEPHAQEAGGINSPPSKSKNAARGWPLDLIYQEYPKRLGATGKAAGMKRLDRIIKSLDDFDLALEAVKRYARHCQAQGNTGTGFVKMFSSFWDPRGDWKEWATMEEVKEKQQATVNGMVVVGKAQMKI